MGKSLYLVNSVYHLLTSIHLRRTVFPSGKADLVLTDVTPALAETTARLEETNLFERVIPAVTKELSHQFSMNREEDVKRCFDQRETLLNWVLGKPLEQGYDQVFFPNFDWLARLLACRYDCPFYWIEDGFSSYVIDFLRPDRAVVNRHLQGVKLGEKTQAALLYEPRLAMRGDHLPNRPLPKLSQQDGDLRQLLNFVFDYHQPQGLPPFLFLEQSFRAEGIQGNDLDLMAQCQQAVGPENFGVKPHPRNGENLALDLGLTRKIDLSVPWELFLLNAQGDIPTVVTVCSNGALSGRLCLGLCSNTVMLYKLYNGKVLWKEDSILWRYLETFRRQFAGKNYYVPETPYELRNILRYLGGQYGD